MGISPVRWSKRTGGQGNLAEEGHGLVTTRRFAVRSLPSPESPAGDSVDIEETGSLIGNSSVRSLTRTYADGPRWKIFSGIVAAFHAPLRSVKRH